MLCLSIINIYSKLNSLYNQIIFIKNLYSFSIFYNF